MSDDGTHASIERRFLAKIDKKPDGCWLWTASCFPNGYGQFRVSGWENGGYAHRAAFLLYVGSIPSGMLVLHTCDVRNCVNPSHLFLGTHADNAQDMSAKGRSSRGDRSGTAKLSEADARAIITDERSLDVIAEAYGVTYGTISKIKLGTTWSHLDVPRPEKRIRRFTAEQFAAIRADTRRQVDIARDYGITQGYVSWIKLHVPHE